MYQSDLLDKFLKTNKKDKKANYDQTLFPRINKRKISVYKIEEEHRHQSYIDSYVDLGYWEDYYTQDDVITP